MIVVLLSSFICTTLASAAEGIAEISIKNVSELQNIQTLLSKEAPGKLSPQMIIRVESNTYVLKDTFRINRSNVCIIAEPGTKAILADHVNKPVLAIGSQEEIPSYTIENICVSGVEIDGNKTNQDVGIFIRFSSELRFNSCTIKNSSSWAVFMGHDENDNGVHDIMFSSNQLLNNDGGILLSSTNDTQSSHTSIVSSVFRGNREMGRDNIQTIGSTIWQTANIFMD